MQYDMASSETERFGIVRQLAFVLFPNIASDFKDMVQEQMIIDEEDFWSCRHDAYISALTTIICMDPTSPRERLRSLILTSLPDLHIFLTCDIQSHILAIDCTALSKYTMSTSGTLFWRHFISDAIDDLAREEDIYEEQNRRIASNAATGETLDQSLRFGRIAYHESEFV